MASALDWKIEDSQKTSILFLKNTNEEKFQTHLAKINSSDLAILVVNCKINESSLPKNTFVFNCLPNKWIELQKALADVVYPINNKIKFAAVTGTNGKTSTVHFVMQILKQMKIQALSFGTLGVYDQNKKILDFALTSPAYIDFRKVIYKYGSDVSFVIFEMSSHALDQERFFQVPLSAAGWTSFTQDHLDYHQNMESYFLAKKKILNYLENNAALFIPHDQVELNNKLATNPKVKQTKRWSDYNFNGSNPLFNASFAKDNFVVAFEMCQELLKDKKLSVDLPSITTAPGRWMLKTFENKTVIIDYAHTPDALINVCRNAKVGLKGKKLKVLFGCGGDRDKTKRPLMGKAVDQFADFIYVTSDNPRTENPEAIIDDILPGISKPYFRNSDREVTLNKALTELMPEEILIVAGKGHEDYIIKGVIKYPYSDEDVCDKFIQKRLP